MAEAPPLSGAEKGLPQAVRFHRELSHRASLKVNSQLPRKTLAYWRRCWLH